MLTNDEIDRRFELAVLLQKEHLLSKTGDMYPFNPENMQEAIAELSDEQKVTLASYAERNDIAAFGDYTKRIILDYWDKCADRQAMITVQKNFDPRNCI